MVEAGGRDNHIWIKVPASFNKTKLGIDAMAVVDPQSMKVIGLAGLQGRRCLVHAAHGVGNTYAATNMIAERAANLVAAT